MLRVRFKANYEDSRPVTVDTIVHPWWETGFAMDESYSIVISYADDLDYILKHWPEAHDINAEEVDAYFFSDRFPKPDWFELPAEVPPC